MDKPLKAFLDQLAWPAAAGNVAWSLATVLIGPISCARIPYILILVVLTIYLSAQWCKNLGSSYESSEGGQFLDLFFIVSIVFFAVSIESSISSQNLDVPFMSLLSMLLILSAGHIKGAWAPKGAGFGYHCLISALIIIVLMQKGLFLNPWTIFICLVYVLFWWICLRTKYFVK